MKRITLKCMWPAVLVLLFSFPTGDVASASGEGRVGLSYDIVEKGTTDTGRAATATVRLKIENVGENPIDKVTAYVVGSRGMVVGLDSIFFGLIESGQTVASEQFDLVVETGNSEDVQPGIVWRVEYWTRYGTGDVELISTPFQQDSCQPVR